MSKPKATPANRPVPDAAARARIVSELGRNLLVEAGAGSGKTQMLAERMAAGVASGAYELEGLVAVTFTRKAAAELRGRFQLALEKELEKGGGEDRERRLRDALSNLERFFAGTIHALCARLLRERPVEAGVSPDFTELDEDENDRLRKQSWRDFHAQMSAAGDAALGELLDAGITPKQLDNAFTIVCSYEDAEFPAADVPMPDAAEAWRAVEEFWAALQALLPAAIDPDSTCDTQDRAQRFARDWRAVARGRRERELLLNLLRTWESKPSVVQKCWSSKPVALEAMQLRADFRDRTVLPHLTAWRQYLYGRCVGLLMRARETAQHERRLRNQLSFSDLLILAARVLRENAEVRGALQRKYRWLFVDEFQDTDPIQAEIVFLLSAAEGVSESPADWRAVPLRPGALFVVGDPKQSIYRFRRADIEIYNEVRKRLGGADDGGRDAARRAPAGDDDGIVRLTTNFRSVPDLCNWANGVFQSRFPAAPTDVAPMFAPLEPYRVAGAGPAMALLTVPAATPADEVAGEEAARIARYIRGEVEAGRRSYGDFLILTRRKKGLRPIAEALEARQVPIEVTGAGAFEESEEVRELALLLAALSDPQDAVALVGVLRGRLFGLSDRDLFAFRQAGGYFNVYAEVASDDPGARRVADALARLRQWSTWRRQLPAGAALERVLEDSGYLALAATSPGGAEAGDLLHAVDRVRAAVEDGATLAEAAEALAVWCGLDEEAKDSTEVDSLPLAPGRPNVVRLMNLHKAKGLEAPVVFLADPLGGYASRVDVRVTREGDRPLGYFKIVEESKGYGKKAIAEPPGWDVHEAVEERYLDAEADRLLYVAATRACDLLVVGRYLGRPGRSTPAWDALSGAMAAASELEVPAETTPAVEAAVDLSEGAAAEAAARILEAHDRVRAPSWSATSVTAETKRLPLARPELADAADPSDPTRAVVPHTPSHRADAGLAWGTLVHGLLEHAMRHPAATRDDLRRLAMWLTMEEPQLRPVIDQALDMVASVAQADFWRDARASAECHEEAPFAMRDSGGAVPAVITGVIDLVHRTAEGWKIVDYKTDVAPDATGATVRYNEQVSTYAAGWSGATRQQASTVIVPVRPEPAKRAVSGADRKSTTS